MTVRTYSAEEKHTLQKQFIETLTGVLIQIMNAS
jgi:hypothetical protein